MNTGTIIVGGSVAGIRTATELRRLGYEHPITVLESQDAAPYDRPPLSKGILTGADRAEAIQFHPREHYSSLDIEVRVGTTAVRLDAPAMKIELADGQSLSATNIVVTSGARARPFPIDSASGRVHTIREISDAIQLADALSRAQRVVVIGGGFIGAEVAASARALGRRAVVIEAAQRPFNNLLGQEVSSMLAELHRMGGTTLHCNATVTRVEQLAAGQRVHMASGAYEDADVVVAGLGAIPEVGWLADSGLIVEGAVCCDAFGHTNIDGIYAAGDVATWADVRTGAPSRHEHWTSAREQADIVARQISGIHSETLPSSVPYVWSDQYGKRVQVLGWPAQADSVRVVRRDPERGSWLALYGAKGLLVAVVGCNAAARAMRYRPLLEDGSAPFEAACSAAS